MKKLLLIALLIVGLHAGDSDMLNTSKDSHNYLSLGIGAASTKALNFVQISYDKKINQNTSYFGLMGLPTIFGFGISWQQNYNQNGWVLSSCIGGNLLLYNEVEGIEYNLGISYQWEIWNREIWNSPTFLSIRLHIGAYETATYLGGLGYEKGWDIMPYPILSLDLRL